MKKVIVVIKSQQKSVKVSTAQGDTAQLNVSRGRI
jgi:hypothetical protein